MNEFMEANGISILLHLFVYGFAIIVVMLLVLYWYRSKNYRWNFDEVREEMKSELSHLDPENPPAQNRHWAENHYRGSKQAFFWMFGFLPGLTALALAILFLCFAESRQYIDIVITLVIVGILGIAWIAYFWHIHKDHKWKYEEWTKEVAISSFTDHFEAKLKNGEVFAIRTTWYVNEGAKPRIVFDAITAQLARACAKRVTAFTLEEAQSFFDAIRNKPPALGNVKLFHAQVLEVTRPGLPDEDHDVSIGTY